MMLSRTGKNLFSLGILQITNYLVPIVAIPVLLSRVGIEKYGVIVLAQGITFLLVAAIDYGLNLTGTRDISQNNHSKSRLHYISTQILHTKLFLNILGFLLLMVLVMLVPKWRQEYFVLLSSYGLVIGQTIFPVWFFQGIQRMQFLTLLNFASRITYLAGLFLFVSEPKDYLYVNIINGTAWTFWSIVGVFLVMRETGLLPILPKPRRIKSVLISNFKIFTSNFLIAGYRAGALIVAGFVLAPDTLGVYGILDKVIALIHSSASVVFRALFPEISKNARAHNSTSALPEINQIKHKLIALVIFGSLLLTILGPDLIGIATKYQVHPSDIRSYFLLIGILPIMILWNLNHTLILLAKDHKSNYLKFNALGLLSLIIFGIPGGFLLQVFGLLIGLIATELAMGVYGHLSLKKMITK